MSLIYSRILGLGTSTEALTSPLQDQQNKMTKKLKTKFLFVLVCILAGLLFQAPQVCRAGFVEKFEPVWEQKRPEPKPARLFVETVPESARVRVLNIAPVFFQGMALEPGRYHVEVSAEGFNTEKRWVTLSAGEDGKISIRLTAVRVERPKPVVEPKPVVVRPVVEGKKGNSLGMKFVYIPPGSFMMGSPSGESGRDGDEKQHRVSLTRGYYMQTTEVTQGQWKRVMGSNPSHFKNCGSNCPVENVSWEDCQKFIRKLNGSEGTRKYRLPTEAEWEYAARAGTSTAIYTGDLKIIGKNNGPALDPIAWYGGNSCVDYSDGYDCSGWDEKQFSCGKCGTHPVAGKKPNSFGLYDMIGNVWEWCQDWKGDYPSGSVTDPTGPSSGSRRVVRGGGWNSHARLCRSANRNRFTPGYRFNALGFRLAFSAGQ